MTGDVIYRKNGPNIEGSEFDLFWDTFNYKDTFSSHLIEYTKENCAANVVIRFFVKIAIYRYIVLMSVEQIFAIFDQNQMKVGPLNHTNI